MRAKNLILLLWLVTFLFVPFLSFATNVRGQVVGTNPFSSSPYPLPGMSVDLYSSGPTGWQMIYRFITGTDGMYYLQNILPGNYVIQINGRMNYPLAVINQPYQDVPPIIVAY